MLVTTRLDDKRRPSSCGPFIWLTKALQHLSRTSHLEELSIEIDVGFAAFPDFRKDPLDDILTGRLLPMLRSFTIDIFDTRVEHKRIDLVAFQTMIETTTFPAVHEKGILRLRQVRGMWLDSLTWPTAELTHLMIFTSNSRQPKSFERILRLSSLEQQAEQTCHNLVSPSMVTSKLLLEILYSVLTKSDGSRSPTVKSSK